MRRNKNMLRNPQEVLLFLPFEHCAGDQRPCQKRNTLMRLMPCFLERREEWAFLGEHPDDRGMPWSTNC